MLSIEECHEILCVTRGCTELEIRSAYKRQALMYHPDKNNGSKAAEEKFKQINNAYETLMNAFSSLDDDDSATPQSQQRQRRQQHSPRFPYAHQREPADAKICIERVFIHHAFSVFQRCGNRDKSHFEEAQKLEVLIEQNMDLLDEMFFTHNTAMSRLWEVQARVSRAMKDQADNLDRIMRCEYRAERSGVDGL